MRNQNNAELKRFAKNAGVFLWQIAQLWEVSEATMTRIMRKTLTETEAQRFKDAVNQIAQQKGEQAHE